MGEREAFHQLRHFYASLLIRFGESVPTVADRLGDSTQVVLDTYAHLWHDSDDRTRAAVDAVLSAPVSGMCQTDTVSG
jgi:integrase